MPVSPPAVVFLRVNCFTMGATDSVCRQLVADLNSCGVPTQIVSLPSSFVRDARKPALPDYAHAVELGVWRWLVPYCRRFELIRQLVFTLSIVGWLRRNRSGINTIVAVDTPSWIEWVAVLARRLRWADKCAAWVLDLSSLQALRLGSRGWGRVKHRLRNRLKMAGLRRLDGIVTIGDCMASAIEAFGIGGIQVIRLGIGSFEGTSPTGSAEQSEFKALYAGTIAARHPTAAIEYAMHLQPASSPVRWMFIGMGSSAAGLKKRTTGLPQVIVGEWLDQSGFEEAARVATLHLSCLDAQALGTCVPSKIYTSIAMGKPCVFVGPADCQAAVDLLRYEAGWVVSEPDQESAGMMLHSLMQSLSEDPSLVEIARKGAERARNELNAAVMAEEWREFLVHSLS